MISGFCVIDWLPAGRGSAAGSRYLASFIGLLAYCPAAGQQYQHSDRVSGFYRAFTGRCPPDK